MARLKRPHVETAKPAVRPFTLDELLDGPRPGRDDPERDQAWLEARAVIGRASHQHPQFDIRKTLTLSGEALELWRLARRQWLSSVVFRDDARLRDA